ncbi:unnamed protein product [Calicophoron daubneyi]|uniref:Large subunit GTPase 1 homolog n=1 Tax=Calicophoron daubneyi TaxID=300641 RepID=A0AAV2TDQ3_CALDB
MVKKRKQLVGQSLLNKSKRAFNPSERHTVIVHGDVSQQPVRSITEENAFTEFFNIAELANSDFTAKKKTFRFLTTGELSGLPVAEATVNAIKAEETYKSLLRIPRRPKWTQKMSADELNSLEKEEFLKWRRSLAKLEEADNITLTPFEKNLELWRQLWRVVERSDIVVQIVDARQPLLYFCPDLETYVHEVDPNKVPVVLVNKSDFLTLEQRLSWANFFESLGVRAIFWSAVLASVSTDSCKPTGEEHEKCLGAMDSKEQTTSSAQNESNPSTESTVNDHIGEINTVSKSKPPENTAAPIKREASPSELSQNSVLPPDRNMARILSATELLDFLSKDTYPRGRPTVRPNQLTIGFVGYPNVGKSSTLNALLGQKKTSVSATPGRTKHFQTLCIRPDLVLCDCPGLVMPSFVHSRADLVVAGVLSIDEMHDCLSPIGVICQQIPKSALEIKYGINLSRPRDPDQLTPNSSEEAVPLPRELLGPHARMHGFMTAKGNPHYDKSARLILKDYVQGRLLYCHPPPGIDGKQFQFLGRDNSGSPPSLTYSEIKKPLRPSKQEILAKPVKVSGTKSKNPVSLTPFDRSAFSQIQVAQPASHIRSCKILALEGEMSHKQLEEGSDSDASSSSWKTVATEDEDGLIAEDEPFSAVSGCTNLAAHFSNKISITSVPMDSSKGHVKKPWRLMSQSKRLGAVLVDSPNPSNLNPHTGRSRKRKEKLRRVYAHLDHHDDI